VPEVSTAAKKKGYRGVFFVSTYKGVNSTGKIGIRSWQHVFGVKAGSRRRKGNCAGGVLHITETTKKTVQNKKSGESIRWIGIPGPSEYEKRSSGGVVGNEPDQKGDSTNRLKRGGEKRRERSQEFGQFGKMELSRGRGEKT